MLPAAHRLRDSAEFRRASRRGRRARSRTLVVHLVDGEGGRVGFVVSRAIGNAVVRNRVKRRLRSAAHAVLPQLPAASVLVVRALPEAADATQAELHDDLVAALRRVTDAAT